jgi:hypothetical protein
MHGPVFEQARTRAGFLGVTVDGESGTIVWPGAPTSPQTRFTSAAGPACGQTRAPPLDGSADGVAALAEPVAVLDHR